MKTYVVLFLAIFSVNTWAYSQDNGIIRDIFVDGSGTIALKLDGGFPQANTDNQCANNNGWASAYAANPALVSVILMAKAAGYTVRVTTEGCQGSSLKVKDVYILG